MLVGDIGTFLRTKKVSFPSFRGNWHLFHGKESLISILLGKLAPFSGQRKVLVHPTGKIGTFSWQRKFLFHPAGKMGTFLTTKNVSFPSCRRNWHLSHAKEFLFPHAGDNFTFLILRKVCIPFQAWIFLPFLPRQVSFPSYWNKQFKHFSHNGEIFI